MKKQIKSLIMLKFLNASFYKSIDILHALLTSFVVLMLNLEFILILRKKFFNKNKHQNEKKI